MKMKLLKKMEISSALKIRYKQPFFNKKNTFCINLDHRTDRLERFSDEISRINGEFTRFSAINGKNLEPKLGLSREQIGCFLSHSSIWQRALKSNLDKVIIFEDDTIFFDDFIDRFDIFMKEDTSDRQIIRLGAYWPNGELYRKASNHAGVIIVPAWGAHAYIVKREAIKILVNNAADMIETDYYLYGTLPPAETNLRPGQRSKIHSIPNYVPLENLCYQDGDDSDIRCKA